MSFSKQLYVTLTLLYFTIFAGYFIVEIKNTKEHLEVESATKVSDAISILTMSLKDILKDKNDPKIKYIISSVSNEDIYKEIRLEDASFFIKDSDLVKKSKDLTEDKWQIINLDVDENIGRVELFSSVSGMEFELNIMEESLTKENIQHYKKPNVEPENIYVFTPNEKYKNSGDITFTFTAQNINDKKINSTVALPMNKTIVKISKDTKSDFVVPDWFTNAIPLEFEEKSSVISADWRTKAIVYVSADSNVVYTKLYEQAKNIALYGSMIFVIFILILIVFMEFILKPLRRP